MPPTTPSKTSSPPSHSEAYKAAWAHYDHIILKELKPMARKRKLNLKSHAKKDEFVNALVNEELQSRGRFLDEDFDTTLSEADEPQEVVAAVRLRRPRVDRPRSVSTRERITRLDGSSGQHTGTEQEGDSKEESDSDHNVSSVPQVGTTACEYVRIACRIIFVFLGLSAFYYLQDQAHNLSGTGHERPKDRIIKALLHSFLSSEVSFWLFDLSLLVTIVTFISLLGLHIAIIGSYVSVAAIQNLPTDIASLNLPSPLTMLYWTVFAPLPYVALGYWRSGQKLKFNRASYARCMGLAILFAFIYFGHTIGTTIGQFPKVISKQDFVDRTFKPGAKVAAKKTMASSGSRATFGLSWLRN